MKLSDGIKIEITKECDDCKLCNITEHPEYLTRCKLGLDVAIGYLSYAPGPNCPGPITMHLVPAAVAASRDRERELMLELVEALETALGRRTDEGGYYAKCEKALANARALLAG